MNSLGKRIDDLEAKLMPDEQQELGTQAGLAAFKCSAFDSGDPEILKWWFGTETPPPPTDEERALAARFPELGPEYYASLEMVYGPIA